MEDETKPAEAPADESLEGSGSEAPGSLPASPQASDSPDGTLGDDAAELPGKPTPTPDEQPGQKPPAPTPKKPRKFKLPKFTFVSTRTLLTAGLFLIVVLVLVGGAFFLRPKPQPDQTVVINTQSLDNGTLNQLSQGDGRGRTELNITADVLSTKDLRVQGTASVQGDLAVQGNLTVNGTTNLQATTINGSLSLNGGLEVSGNTSLSGSLSVTGQLTTGGLSVGSITTSNLTVNNNLTLGGHLIPTGGAPSVSAGPAARGGSVSISGNDTAGTITINTGNQGLGGAHTGEMAVITFRTPFATTPKVQLTPINIDAAGLNYYAARGPRFFNVNSTSTVADGTTYVFDYLVTQ